MTTSRLQRAAGIGLSTAFIAGALAVSACSESQLVWTPTKCFNMQAQCSDNPEPPARTNVAATPDWQEVGVGSRIRWLDASESSCPVGEPRWAVHGGRMVRWCTTQ